MQALSPLSLRPGKGVFQNYQLQKNLKYVEIIFLRNVQNVIYQFRPKSLRQSPGGLSQLSPAEENNEVPDEEEKMRFKYRHNYPYRRQPRPGDFGARRSTPPAPTTSTTSTPSPVSSTTKSSGGYHSHLGYQPVITEAPSGPFVTVPQQKQENVSMARQPKVASYNDYSAGSNLHEVRVLPPDEFHHLLARVDGKQREVNIQIERINYKCSLIQ